MNKNKILIFLLFILFKNAIFAQSVQKIGNNPTTINSSAVLELESTNKGLLMPRMTTDQRNAITNPATGLVIFNITTNELQTNTGTDGAPIWTSSGIGATGATGAAGTNGINGKTVLNGSSDPDPGIGVDGDFFINTSSNTIFGPKVSGSWPATGTSLVGETGPAGSDATVTGTAPINVASGVVSLNPSGVTDTYLASSAVTTAKILDGVITPSKISTTGASATNNILKYNGTSWAFAPDANSGTVTNVTGNSPISVTNASTTPEISIATADANTSGALTSTDWNTFNNKLSSFSTSLSGLTSTTSNGAVTLTGTLNVANGGTGTTTSTGTGGSVVLSNSPTLSTPTLSATPASTDNSTAVASTAFVNNAVTTAATPDATTTSKGKIQLAGDLNGTADSPTINTNAVTTTKIADNAVNSNKIANETIATADVANSAITGVKLQDNIALPGTASMTLPSGTTLERPETPTAGMSRYNTTDSIMEYYNGTAWIRPTAGIIYTGSTSTVLNGTSFERAALTGDVTAAQNNNSLTIAQSAVNTAKIADTAVTTAKISNSAVTKDKIENLSPNTLLGNNSGSVAAPSEIPMSSSATASNVAVRDGNANLSANNFINSFATNVTSASSLSLTVLSKQIQQFTGSIAQTVILPLASALSTGHQFYIINDSSSNLTVNSSGGNTVATIPVASRAVITCISNSAPGNTASSWSASVSTASGTPAGTSLTSGKIWVGNGSDQATAVAMTGDATISNTGAVTINNNAVTTAKIADTAVTTAKISNSAVTKAKIENLSPNTLLGNNSGSVAAPSEIPMSSSATASNVAVRDDNANLSANNFISNIQTITAIGESTSLSAASPAITKFIGTTFQNVNLPSIANVSTGHSFTIYNSTNNDIIVYNNLSPVLTISEGMVGTVFKNSSAAWETFSVMSSIFIGSVTSENSNGASITGNVLSLAPADTSNPGIVTASGTQTFAGNKTFNGASTFTGGVTTSGTANLNLGIDGSANTINIGTGVAAKTVNIGSTNGSSATTISAGTGNISIDGINISTITIGDPAQTGAINIGTSTAAHTTNIGVANAASVSTVNIATGTDAAHAVTIGTASSSTSVPGNLSAKRYTNSILPSVTANTSSTSVDLGASNYFSITLSSSTSLSFTNMTIGSYTIKLNQDATGNRTVTWPSNFKWSGGTAPTLTATANKTDVVTFFYDGTNGVNGGTNTVFASIVQNF
jgi:hypothetical protein